MWWGIWLWGQIFYVEVASQALEHQFRSAEAVSRLRSSSSLWRSLHAVYPVVVETETALRRWFVLEFRGSDSVEILNRLRSEALFLHVEGATHRKLENLTGWHHIALQTTTAWQQTRGSPTVTVAILDSGIEWGLTAFEGQFAVNAAEDLNANGILDSTDLNGRDEDGNGFPDDVIGYDFTDQPYVLSWGDYQGEDPLPADENGHGTAMASLIGAKPERSPIAGIAPGCRLLILRCFNGEGYGEDDDIARAILYAVKQGAKVINCSFGERQPSRLLRTAIEYATQRGVVVVASSGNGTGRQPHFPSGFPEVIAVGAYSWQEEGRYYLWPLSGYYKVDWIAPGDRVPTLRRDGTPQLLSGTSVATALSSGAIALLLSRFPSLSPAEVRATFCSHAQPLPSTESFLQGSGRLNLPPALVQPRSGIAGWLFPPPYAALTPPFPLVFSTYHSLLTQWEIYAAPSIDGPWRRIAQGTSSRLRDTLPAWTPSYGENILRLLLHLRNGREENYPLRLSYPAGGANWQSAKVLPGWKDGIAGNILDYHLNVVTPVCAYYSSGVGCAEPIDSIGGIWIPGLGADSTTLIAGQTTPTLSLRLALPVRSSHATPHWAWGRATSEAPIGWYGEERLDTFLLSWVPTAPENTQGKLYFLRREGTRWIPYDSIPRSILPRDIRDWNGDGRPELLCVWQDSFFIYEGAPARYIVWQGKGLAARLAENQSVWIRTAEGHYQRVFRSGPRGLTLHDTTLPRGNTTIPRLLRWATPTDTFWVFGNYEGWLFLYDTQGHLQRAYPTRLEGVGSFLYTYDTDRDGYEELYYAGRGGKTWWEIGCWDLRTPPRGLFRFWGERSYGRFLAHEDTAALWLPPQLYALRLRRDSSQVINYDDRVWGAALLQKDQGHTRFLLGLDRDTMLRFYPMLPLFGKAPAWSNPGGVSPTQAQLRWHPVPTTSGYELLRVEIGQPPTQLYVGSDTSYLDSSLQPERSYTYFVRTQEGGISPPFYLRTGMRPCLETLQVISPNLYLLRGRGYWKEASPSFFRLLPSGTLPEEVIASGGSLLLRFPTGATGSSIKIDSLLTDEWGRYLSTQCTLLRISSGSPPHPCISPLRWEIVSSHEVQIEFESRLPTQAYDMMSYEVLPMGCVEKITGGEQSIRLKLSVSPYIHPLRVQWKWQTSPCPQAVSFSPKENPGENRGIFPNPVEERHGQVYFWGFPAGARVRVLSPSGELCAIFQIPEGELPFPWDLHSVSGERLRSGVYVLYIEKGELRYVEKLVVE
ncbi:MAG: S8 family serine peptidase [Bacteroidia bacterium]|nr:S8 family serine peptidase [Bacteroidia bacterium]